MNRKLGLALGGGSSRGLAHIGVIKALEEENIEINYVAGTSIGSLIGATYASGTLEEAEIFAKGIDWKLILAYFDVVIPKRGLLDGKKIYDLVSEYMKKKNIEDLQIPFCAVATDLYTGKEVRINRGSVVDAVRASISLPGIFTPFEKNGTFLVDGGLVNPVPVNVVREMGAEIVIAVDLNHDIIGKSKWEKKTEPPGSQSVKKGKIKDGSSKKSYIISVFEDKYKRAEGRVKGKINRWMSKEASPNIFDTIGQSINIMEYKLTQTNLEIFKPDILIQPSVGYLNLFDFTHAESTINEGYKKTKLIIENIKRLIY